MARLPAAPAFVRGRYEVEVGGQTRQVTVEPAGGGRVAVRWEEVTRLVDVTRIGAGALLLLGAGGAHDSREVTAHETAPGELRLGLAGRLVRARVRDPRRQPAAGVALAGEHPVSAPMPGRVVRVLVEPGETVEAGQALVVVEAMKMENAVSAPAAGVVSEVRAAAGASVEAGAVLAVVRVESSEP